MFTKLFLKIPPKIRAWSALALMIFAAALLLYLPADHFDEGQSICLSVLLLDTECYACGMTRGIQHLIHFEFAEAWRFNKLSFVVLPLLIYLISSSIIKDFMASNSSKTKL